MGIELIGDGIKTNLDTITGLRVFAPKELPDSVSEFPCALILPAETNYGVDFSGGENYIIRIILLFGRVDRPSALNKILDYIEPSSTYSVQAAINADKTLDSSADTCILRRNLGFGSTTWGGHTYLSTEFELEVWT